MNKEFYKNKKFWIVVGIIAFILIVIITLVLVLNNKGKDNIESTNNSSQQSTKSVSKKVWPDLKEYDITTLSVGKINSVKDECNKNNYKLNYVIDVESISKEDIDKYLKDYDNWEINEVDGCYILIRSTDEAQFSLVIIYDEENNTAQFVISSI